MTDLDHVIAAIRRIARVEYGNAIEWERKTATCNRLETENALLRDRVNELEGKNVRKLRVS